VNAKELYGNIPFLITAEEEKSFWRRWGIGWWISVDGVLVGSCKGDAELAEQIREIKAARECGALIPCRVHGDLNEHESIAVTEAVAAANGYRVIMTEEGEESFVKVEATEDAWRFHQKRMRMLGRYDKSVQSWWARTDLHTDGAPKSTNGVKK
jgi:hypothetical protein